jgi:hypothetical protein
LEYEDSRDLANLLFTPECSGRKITSPDHALKGTWAMPANKGRAKQVIWEILHQAGGELGKTKLFKAFWLAHLYYSKIAPGYLTDWPIVRMPNGPGIDKADCLLLELTAADFVLLSHVPRGPFTEINCRITGKPMAEDLPGKAGEAIAAAVKDVQNLSAEEISEWSHDFSRSWKTTPNGSELDIYCDLIPDDVYEMRKQELAEMKKAYEGLFE